MRNKRLFVVLAGATVFGLVAAVAVSRYLANAQAFSRNMNAVVIAKGDIALGSDGTLRWIGAPIATTAVTTSPWM